MTDFVLQTQPTYARHVAERRAYNFVPLAYETWLSWHMADAKKYGCQGCEYHKAFNLEKLYALANKGPDSLFYWFTSSSGAIELVLYAPDVKQGSHSGRCDEDIAALLKKRYIAAQLDRLKPAAIQAELREYFFDSDFDPQCADDENNRARLLWVACGDILDNGEFEYVEVARHVPDLRAH